MKTAATAPSPASTMVLYSFWLSSCSWRVRFALNLKGRYRTSTNQLIFSKESNLVQAASIVGCSMQPLHMKTVLEFLEKKAGREESLLWAQVIIKKGFSALENLLRDIAGRYSTGDEVSMADVFLAPQIAIAMSRFHIDMSKYPALRRVYESCQALPAFQASIPERQPDAPL